MEIYLRNIFPYLFLNDQKLQKKSRGKNIYMYILDLTLNYLLTLLYHERIVKSASQSMFKK